MSDFLLLIGAIFIAGSVAATFGLFAGVLVSYSKISLLTEKLADAEERAGYQAQALSELTGTLQQVTNTLERHKSIADPIIDIAGLRSATGRWSQFLEREGIELPANCRNPEPAQCSEDVSPVKSESAHGRRGLPSILHRFVAGLDATQEQAVPTAEQDKGQGSPQRRRQPDHIRG